MRPPGSAAEGRGDQVTDQRGLFEPDEPMEEDDAPVKARVVHIGTHLTRDEWVSKMGVTPENDRLYETCTVRKLGAGYSVSFTREVEGKVLTFSGMSLSPRQFKLLVESVRNLVADLAQRQ